MADLSAANFGQALSQNVDALPRTEVAPADPFTRIRGNVQKMISQKAPEEDIDGYLKSEGLTANQFKERASQPDVGPGEWYDPKLRRVIPDPGWFFRNAQTLSAALDGPTNAVLSGATLGLNDEVGAAGGAIGDVIGRAVTGQHVGLADIPGYTALTGDSGQGVSSLVTGQRTPTIADAYDRNLQQIRARQADYAEQHPVANVGLQLLGGLGSGGASLAGQAAPSIGKGIAQATGLGAVAGAGSAEGGFDNRLIGGGVGGLTGAAIGSAIPAAGYVGGKLGNAALNTFAPEALRGGAGARADAILSKYLSRDLEGSGQTPNDLVNALMEARIAGQPMSIMDAAGSNTTRLGRLAASAPGRASQQAEQFVAGSRAEMPYLAEQSFANRVAPADAAAASDQALAQAGRAQARPLYEQAYNEPFTASPELLSFLDRPAFQQAAARAERIAQNEGDQLPIEQNLKFFDYLKRGLDDVLEGYRDKTTGRLVLDTEGNAINNARQEFVSLLDQQAPPAYQAARSVWRGMLDNQQAIQAGRAFLKGDRTQIADNFAKLYPNQQDLFRQGMARQLSEMVGRGQLGQIQRLMQASPDFARKLQGFLTPQQFQGVQADLGRMATMGRRNNTVGGGSVTARITADQADAAGIEGRLGAALSLAQSARNGGLTGIASNLLTRGYGRAVGLSEPVAGNVADALFTTDLPLQQALLSRLGNQVQSNAATQQLRRAMLSSLLGGSSSTAGRALAPQEPR